MGKKNGKTSIGSSGHAGGTRPDQTRKNPKDLSVREREVRGRGEGEGVYTYNRVIRSGYRCKENRADKCNRAGPGGRTRESFNVNWTLVYDG